MWGSLRNLKADRPALRPSRGRWGLCSDPSSRRPRSRTGTGFPSWPPLDAAGGAPPSSCVCGAGPFTTLHLAQSGKRNPGQGLLPGDFKWLGRVGWWGTDPSENETHWGDERRPIQVRRGPSSKPTQARPERQPPNFLTCSFVLQPEDVCGRERERPGLGRGGHFQGRYVRPEPRPHQSTC